MWLSLKCKRSSRNKCKTVFHLHPFVKGHLGTRKWKISWWYNDNICNCCRWSLVTAWKSQAKPLERGLGHIIMVKTVLSILTCCLFNGYVWNKWYPGQNVVMHRQCRILWNEIPIAVLFFFIVCWRHFVYARGNFFRSNAYHTWNKMWPKLWRPLVRCGFVDKIMHSLGFSSLASRFLLPADDFALLCFAVETVVRG